jgi:hypothetical protein
LKNIPQATQSLEISLNILLRFAPDPHSENSDLWSKNPFKTRNQGKHPLIILILSCFIEMKAKNNFEKNWFWGIPPSVITTFWENCVSFPALLRKIGSHQELRKLFLGVFFLY